MEEKDETLSKIFNVPVLAAALGSILFFIGTFLVLFRIEVLNFSYMIYLKDLRIDSMLMAVRIISILMAIIVLTPQIPNIAYSAFGIVFFAVFLPRTVKAYRAYTEAQNYLNLFGLSSYLDISSFVKRGAGYYLLFIGMTLVLIFGIYFAVKFFVKSPEEE